MKRSIPLLLAVSLLAGLFTLAATTPGAGPMAQDLVRVLEAQRLLLAQEPSNAAAWNDLGNLLVLAGQPEAAEEAYLRAVELDPDSAAFHYNLALLLQEDDRFKRAAEHYRRVLELAPDHAWAHYQLGVIQEERGNRSRAIELYGEAFRLDPLLAFADVNPHVIESDLITEAMLLGYRRGLVEPHAPRMYDDPGRITYMLVRPDLPGQEAPGQEAPKQEAPGARTAPDTVEQDAPGTPGAPPTLPPQQRRVLDSEDLGQGPVNQAAPQGRAGYRPPGQQPPSGRSPSTVRSWRPPTQPQEGAREQRRAEPQRQRPGGVVLGGTVGTPGTPGNPGGARQPEAEDGPPPTTRTVVPGGRTPRGVGSTGSLEMILEPAPTRREARG